MVRCKNRLIFFGAVRILVCLGFSFFSFFFCECARAGWRGVCLCVMCPWHNLPNPLLPRCSRLRRGRSASSRVALEKTKAFLESTCAVQTVAGGYFYSSKDRLFLRAGNFSAF